MPLLFSAIAVPHLRAEGIASWTKITAENIKKLEHHGLAVLAKRHNGRTSFTFVIRPHGGYPKEVRPDLPFSVVIFGEDKKEILAQFDPRCGQANKIKGLPKGARVIFEVADHLVDQVEIMYHLPADGGERSHLFQIEPGQLGEVAEY